MVQGQNGFVRLYRNIMDWGWYTDSNTARLFIHCILKANYTDKEWHGIKIPAGSFVTSYEKLAKELNLTKRQIQIALNHLKKSHEVLHKITPRYSIITVNNYASYQTNVMRPVTPELHNSNSDVTQMLTTNKRNKGRKEEYSINEVFKELKEEGVFGDDYVWI